MQIHLLKSKYYKGVFEQNSYLLTNKNDAIIIDAGADVNDIKQILNGKKLKAILITHIHFDHIWFVEEYLKEFPEADVFVKENEEGRFSDTMLNASFLIGREMQKNVSQDRIKYYSKNMKIGSFIIDVIYTPGHSDDSVCLLINKNLFSGDTLFFDGVGRTDLKDGNSKKLEESLKLIRGLEFDNFYPGHYNSGTKEEAIKTIDRFC